MSREKIDQIAKRVDLEEIISRYTQVKNVGGSTKAVCPFHHNDTDPSLDIEKRKGVWYCFGCGRGGDVFSFISEIENLSFIESARKLGDEVGVKLNESNGTSRQAKLYKVLDGVAKYYHDRLMEDDKAEKARQYLYDRGYTDEHFEEFQLGYALPDWNDVTSKLVDRFDESIAKDAGLSKENGKHNGLYDRFRDRIIFPIQSNSGRTVAFGGRAVGDNDEGPKYINSPGTEIYKKGNHLYGLNVARKHINGNETLVLVEGYTDVIASYQGGVKNVVASLGTSLTDRQAALLSRYADTVIVSYDRDEAGEKATLKGGKKLLNEGLTVKVAGLDPDQDPADLVEGGDSQEYQAILGEAEPFYSFFLARLKKKYDITRQSERKRALEASKKFLKTLENSLTRQRVIDELVNLLNVSEAELKRQLRGDAHLQGNERDAGVKDYELELDDWVLVLVLEGEITRMDLQENGRKYGLKSSYRSVIDELVSHDMQVDEAISELQGDEASILSRAELLELPEDIDLKQAKEDIFEQLELFYYGKWMEKARKKIENGKAGEVIEKIKPTLP